ncbi:MAG TPA: histidine--tRNA ligase [Candidatus Saccharimonadales bacterium]|nr:histidine--tRNA ligase [Candidatus Saccharimonadales bacterium]
MALSTQPYKGARDFYPEDRRLQKYLFSKMRTVTERFGYEEYDAPILEPIELYMAKTGDEIVHEQTYVFQDRGGRTVTLRPEMTPSVSRMVAAKRQELQYPLRWYSIPNLWRYERPQHGRLREHWQLNVDIFGVKDASAEIEIIQIADAILREFGATPDMYTIRLNSRKMMDFIMREDLKLSDVQAHTLSRLIDRRAKMPADAFAAAVDAIFTPSQRDTGNSDRLLELLDMTRIEQLPEALQRQPATQELKELMATLEQSRIPNVIFDITLMRGLDYYTDIVFEVYDNHPDNNRSMFGGGRYDGLVGLFGVDPLPTVGFGMGDVTLRTFLEGHGLLPNLRSETDVYVITIGQVYQQAQAAIQEMRELGLNVAVAPAGSKTDKQIKIAHKKGIHYVLFIGQKELEKQQYTLRNLLTSQEEQHSIARIVSIIRDYRTTEA